MQLYMMRMRGEIKRPANFVPNEKKKYLFRIISNRIRATLLIFLVLEMVVDASLVYIFPNTSHVRIFSLDVLFFAA